MKEKRTIKDRIRKVRKAFKELKEKEFKSLSDKIRPKFMWDGDMYSEDVRKHIQKAQERLKGVIKENKEIGLSEKHNLKIEIDKIFKEEFGEKLTNNKPTKEDILAREKALDKEGEKLT